MLSSWMAMNFLLNRIKYALGGLIGGSATFYTLFATIKKEHNASNQIYGVAIIHWKMSETFTHEEDYAHP